MVTAAGFSCAPASMGRASSAAVSATAILVLEIMLSPSLKPPRRQRALGAPHQEIEREAGEAEHEQAHDHDVAEQELAGIPDHPAEPGGGGDDLGRDQHGVGEAEADAHAGADRRQAGRHEDVAEELPAAGAEAQG